MIFDDKCRFELFDAMKIKKYVVFQILDMKIKILLKQKNMGVEQKCVGYVYSIKVFVISFKTRNEQYLLYVSSCFKFI